MRSSNERRRCGVRKLWKDARRHARQGFRRRGFKKQAEKQKIIKDVIAIVAAILVFAIAVGVTTSFVGYRGAVRKAMNAYKKADVDALVDMSCSFFKNQDYKDSLAYKYKFRMEEDFDGVDPSECSVKYKITKTAEFSDS